MQIPNFRIYIQFMPEWKKQNKRRIMAYIGFYVFKNPNLEEEYEEIRKKFRLS